ARADHAIAMHGEPLYPEGYTHFDYANPAAPRGGAIEMARHGGFDNLNSLVIKGNVPAGLDGYDQLIYDSLMKRAWGEPFTLYGLVAKSIDVAPDRSWIVFHLDERARFHDGTPLTAGDVEFTFESYRAHGHPVRRRVYGLVKDVEVVDAHT